MSGQHESASSIAYRRLERLIVTLELAPGATVTEGALIERTELGRTPVREAIQRLAWEGLIDVRPRAGLAIAPLHAADWTKVIDARRGVESLLARSAARNATPAAVDLFYSAAIAMERAATSSDVMAFLDADKSFDEALAEASDNAFAARVAQPLQTHSRRFWFRFQRGASLAESAGRHVEIIQAILAHDPDRAAAEADRLNTLLRAFAEDAAG